MKRIAIFASGSGTNAEHIIRYFKANGKAIIEVVMCNNPKAVVIERAKNLHTPSLVFTRQEFYESQKIERLLERLKIDLIVLAGFLWLVPESLIKKFPNRIVNIHPALLPQHGGKGYYGSKVHDAVLQSGEKKSGITIHYVNEKFDEGEIIFQASCDIDPGDTPDTLAKKIHLLEYEHYPRVIEEILSKQ
jgi:phosphoribosylglycinamide formyltransferase-1